MNVGPGAVTLLDVGRFKAFDSGDRIELRGFGVFQVKPRKRGIGRNPRTGKEVRIPPGRTIRFKPGKDLQNIG
ncbi:MAG: HU family DNA-binding protein [Proteobacteria bacterium]|nr:HU family DNA-binding protein [Pseudomonadota bacterium]